MAAAAVLVLAAAAVAVKLFILKPEGPVEYEITPLDLRFGHDRIPDALARREPHGLCLRPGREREPRHLGPAGLGRQASPPDESPGRRLVPFVLARRVPDRLPLRARRRRDLPHRRPGRGRRAKADRGQGFRAQVLARTAGGSLTRSFPRPSSSASTRPISCRRREESPGRSSATSSSALSCMEPRSSGRPTAKRSCSGAGGSTILNRSDWWVAPIDQRRAGPNSRH